MAFSMTRVFFTSAFPPYAHETSVSRDCVIEIWPVRGSVLCVRVAAIAPQMACGRRKGIPTPVVVSRSGYFQADEVLRRSCRGDWIAGGE